MKKWKELKDKSIENQNWPFVFSRPWLFIISSILLILRVFEMNQKARGGKGKFGAGSYAKAFFMQPLTLK